MIDADLERRAAHCVTHYAECSAPGGEKRLCACQMARSQALDTLLAALGTTDPAEALVRVQQLRAVTEVAAGQCVDCRGSGSAMVSEFTGAGLDWHRSYCPRCASARNVLDALKGGV
jgi:hypothetical protein